MENLLTINNGNTSSSVGFYNHSLTKVVPYSELKPEERSGITHVITSEVGEGITKWDGPKFFSIKDLLKDNTLLHMPINYSETIGEDRLAGAYWVFKNFIQTRKAERVLLVDAGTFTTLDLITKDGFEGGHIFPGTETLLNSFTRGSQLPELPLLSEQKNIGLPKSTEEAIYGSIQMAEQGLYEKWWNRFRPELIVLSGGAASWHKKYLPNEIIESPYVVHLGLYEAFKDMTH